MAVNVIVEQCCVTAHSSHYHNYSDRLHHKLGLTTSAKFQRRIRTTSTRVTEIGELARGVAHDGGKTRIGDATLAG